MLDRNGFGGVGVLPPGDRLVADLLVKAASGTESRRSLAALVNQHR
jgi:hypothetical protein